MYARGASPSRVVTGGDCGLELRGSVPLKNIRLGAHCGAPKYHDILSTDNIVTPFAYTMLAPTMYQLWTMIGVAMLSLVLGESIEWLPPPPIVMQPSGAWYVELYPDIRACHS